MMVEGSTLLVATALSELDAARKGPVVLKERVRSIAGDLVIESIPERGVRLEVTFAKEA